MGGGGRRPRAVGTEAFDYECKQWRHISAKTIKRAKEWGSFPSFAPPPFPPSSFPLLPPASDPCNIKSPRIARVGKKRKEGMEVEGSDGS